MAVEVHGVVADGEAIVVAPPITTGVRPRAEGKFFFVGEEKLYVRGVTYGPFARMKKPVTNITTGKRWRPISLASPRMA